jgi:hypothetical protein
MKCIAALLLAFWSSAAYQHTQRPQPKVDPRHHTDKCDPPHLAYDFCSHVCLSRAAFGMLRAVIASVMLNWTCLTRSHLHSFCCCLVLAFPVSSIECCIRHGCLSFCRVHQQYCSHALECSMAMPCIVWLYFIGRCYPENFGD